MRRVDRGGVGTYLIELNRQGHRGGGGGTVMNEYVRPGRVQRARDFRAYPARAAGDQNHPVAQRRAFNIGFHACQP